jgi:hypothetical protein
MCHVDNKRRAQQPPANLALIIQSFSQLFFSPMVRRILLQVTSHLTDLPANLTSSE